MSFPGELPVTDAVEAVVPEIAALLLLRLQAPPGIAFEYVVTAPEHSELAPTIEYAGVLTNIGLVAVAVQ